MKMFNQGTSKPSASMKENAEENGDMAMAGCCEELVELDDVQLATVVGGWLKPYTGSVVIGQNLTTD
jgi:hypothetical protein